MSEKETCPQCGNDMLPAKEPLRIRGTYVGNYAAMSCPVCRYYYFTDDEYDLAWRDARSLGLIGIPFPSRVLPVFTLQEITSRTTRLAGLLRFDEFANETLEDRLKQHARGRSDNNSEPNGLDLVSSILVTKVISVGEQQRQ